MQTGGMKIYLIGGFLGSGKTTAVSQAALELMRQGRRVAVITNDQGSRQVDTAYVHSQGIPVKQVADGCFCCQYDQLDGHLRHFISEMDPEYVFAESVGSCTDLIATVAKPLASMFPGSSICISIFADAELVSSLMFGRASFISEEIQYLYKKQLMEADLLIMNKTDLLMESQRLALQQRLRHEYPSKKILCQDSRNSDHIEEWLKNLRDWKTNGARQSLELEYDQYAKGEMQLSWLDYRVDIQSSKEPVSQVLQAFIKSVHQVLKKEMGFVGHVKFLVEANGTTVKVSLTSTEDDIHRLATLPEAFQATMTINARVQGQPEWLGTTMTQCILEINKRPGVTLVAGEASVFTPGYPHPQHRIP